MKYIFTLLSFLFILSSCNVVKNLNPGDGPEQKVLKLPCKDKDQKSSKYFRIYSMYKSDNMDMAQDLGMANAASKLADKIKKDVENTINIAKDQKRSGSAVASIENASKDIAQYTKIALTDIEYTCDELTSDGKYYYHYCVVQVPKSSVFKKTGSNDQAMDLLLELNNEIK
ncbi:MAG: hypothetical protein CMP58_04620 [Flavobacteriales bacterium]|nr:hypothetical protein [Flavobacteriales bacterium]|tara:strand:- start:1690 stop:2202 length:513 start_codon:yes stop_codon:yes gene_type:complete